MIAPPVDVPVLGPGPPALGTNVQGVRLSMKAADQLRGHFDGVWWPRSMEPLEEFPGLIRAVADQISGRITRLAYDLNAWLPVPRIRKLLVDGIVIRLEGFGTGSAHTLMVSNQDHTRLRLLVIPPQSSSDEARRIAHQALVEHPEWPARDLVDTISRSDNTFALANLGRSTL